MKRRYLKQIVSVAMVLSVLIVSVLHNPVRADAVALVQTDGRYYFISDLKCSYNNNYLTIKQTDDLKVIYDAKETENPEFDWCGEPYRNVYDSCKFKLADKIYRYDWEDPVHTVKKYGFDLSVTHGKNISKSKLISQETSYKKNPTYISLVLVVKNGKVVALGDGA